MTEKRSIAVEEFSKALDEVVDEFGDYHVYVPSDPEGKCRYKEDGATGEWSCLLGKVLGKLDVPYDPDFEGLAIDSVLTWVFADVPVSLVYAAQAAQDEQDTGSTWGVARQTFRYFLDHYND